MGVQLLNGKMSSRTITTRDKEFEMTATYRGNGGIKVYVDEVDSVLSGDLVGSIHRVEDFDNEYDAEFEDHGVVFKKTVELTTDDGKHTVEDQMPVKYIEPKESVEIFKMRIAEQSEKLTDHDVDGASVAEEVMKTFDKKVIDEVTPR